MLTETKVAGTYTLRQIVANPAFYGLPGHSDADYKAFFELVCGLLNPDPAKRFTWKDIMESEFVRSIPEQASDAPEPSQ